MYKIIGRNEMNGVLGKNSVTKAILVLEKSSAKDINFGQNHSPGSGLMTKAMALQFNMLPLCNTFCHISYEIGWGANRITGITSSCP